MLIGSHACVQTSLTRTNFAFELIDYRWEAGSEVYESQSAATLLWRMEPNRLDLLGRIGDSPIDNFGQLMLLPPQIPLRSHGPTNRPGRSHVLACRFDPVWLQQTTGLRSEAMREDVCISLSNRQIEYGMRRLWSALSVPSFAGDLLAEGLATTMAADLADQFLNSHAQSCSSGHFTARQSKLIEDYLAADENWPPSITTLSAALRISETHFRRLFKASMGQTFHRHIEDIRFEKAKHLLRTTDLPLKVISYRLGFAHASAFSVAFSKLAGTSPRAFRLNNAARL